MSDPFVPFFSGPEREAHHDSRFEVLVVPQARDQPAPSPTPSSASASASGTVKTAKAAKPASSVTPPDRSAPSPAPHPGQCPGSAHAAEPEITLDREGDRIVRITVRCTCGQVLELNCTY